MNSSGFDRQWLAKLSRRLRDTLGDDIERRVLAGSEEMLSENRPEASVEWTSRAMGLLDSLLSDQEKKDVMVGCACHYPESALDDVREACRDGANVDLAIEMLQRRFVSFLKEDLNLSDDTLHEVLDRRWGLAGVREGNTIIATKIPKSNSLAEYFTESDPDKKKRLYCHCPRVRGSIGLGPTISSTYCYCGAGFYKAIWEHILGRPLRVEVLESVLSGGDVCKFAIHISSRDSL